MSTAGRTSAAPEFSVFVGNLDLRTALADMEELLYELFLQAGPLSHVYVPFDKESGTHRCYGFVEFLHTESVPYAIKLLNGIKLCGRPLLVKSALQDDDGGVQACINPTTAAQSSVFTQNTPQPLFPVNTSSQDRFSFGMSTGQTHASSNVMSESHSSIAALPFGPPAVSYNTPLPDSFPITAQSFAPSHHHYPPPHHHHPPPPSHHHHHYPPPPPHHHYPLLSQDHSLPLTSDFSTPGPVNLPSDNDNPFFANSSSTVPINCREVIMTANTFDSDDVVAMEGFHSFQEDRSTISERNSAASFLKLEGSHDCPAMPALDRGERSSHHRARAVASDHPTWVQETVRNHITQYHLSQLGTALQNLRETMNQKYLNTQ